MTCVCVCLFWIYIIFVPESNIFCKFSKKLLTTNHLKDIMQAKKNKNVVKILVFTINFFLLFQINCIQNHDKFILNWINGFLLWNSEKKFKFFSSFLLFIFIKIFSILFFRLILNYVCMCLSRQLFEVYAMFVLLFLVVTIGYIMYIEKLLWINMVQTFLFH